MGKEVEMADAPAEGTKPVEETPVDEPSAPTPLERLLANVTLIEKAVKQKETRTLFSKLIRLTQAVRKQMTAGDVAAFTRATLPSSLPSTAVIIDHLQQAGMDVAAPADRAAAPSPPADPLPEVEIYAYLLALLVLVDAKHYIAARSLANAAVTRLAAFNRRTLDALAARVYFYYAFTAEKTGAAAEVRSALLAAHRTAVLRHDDAGQETLLNLLLRNYLLYDLYDQAEALRAKAQRDSCRSSAQHARLLYYQGRIRAVRLEYTDARDALAQALRKAPAGAVGFRAEASKWLVVVRLLLGEVPRRAELAPPGLAPALAAYLALAGAVRAGDLSAFAAVASKHAATFKADGTVHLVTRLRANVIRAGLRRIAAAYSRISLADVAAKLGLASTEDAEFVVAKAIRDGNVAAKVDHDAGVVVASGGADVYATDEPLAAFHARIAFCMEVRNEAARAMRYDTRGGAGAAFEDANEAREKQEQELAAVLDDDDADF